jgi:hypothetical protein
MPAPVSWLCIRETGNVIGLRTSLSQAPALTGYSVYQPPRNYESLSTLPFISARNEENYYPHPRNGRVAGNQIALVLKPYLRFQIPPVYAIKNSAMSVTHRSDFRNCRA